MNYTLSTSAAPGAKRSVLAGLKKLAPVMEGEKAGVVQALVAIVVNAGAALTAPVIIARAIDTAVRQGDRPALFRDAALAMAVY